MNILYLTNHLNIGGISSYVFTLARELKKRGHNIYIASSGGELCGAAQREGFNYKQIPIRTKSDLSPKILISFLKLKNIIESQHIDIVHANTRVTQILACLLEKRTGVAFISTCHGFFKRRLARRLFPCWGRRVIAISEQVRQHLAEDFKVNPQKINIIHNGIDIDRFKLISSSADKLIAKNKLGLNEGPVVGIVARLSDVKGHVYLIEAMKNILIVFPQAKLLIVGEGKIKQHLVRFAQGLGVEKNIIFFPSIDDTEKVLAAMDIFVLPSLKEGLGLALMEAMACGLAVIGSEVGGIKSLIKHKENGLLVQPRNAKELTEGILELLRNPALAQYLGKNAREFIGHNFSSEKMAVETQKLYEECVRIKH